MFDIINHKLFNMKNLFFSLILLLISLSLYSQEDEKVVIYNFFKVNKGHEESFEKLMKTIIADKVKRTI